MESKKIQGGFSAIVLVAVLAALVVLVAAAFLLKSPFVTRQQEVSELMSEEVSDSTDIDVIEKEIEDTQVDSPDSDFQELDSSASEL